MTGVSWYGPEETKLVSCCPQDVGLIQYWDLPAYHGAEAPNMAVGHDNVVEVYPTSILIY